jgi:hypothetical protein
MTGQADRCRSTCYACFQGSQAFKIVTEEVCKPGATCGIEMPLVTAARHSIQIPSIWNTPAPHHLVKHLAGWPAAELILRDGRGVPWGRLDHFQALSGCICCHWVSASLVQGSFQTERESGNCPACSTASHHQKGWRGREGVGRGGPFCDNPHQNPPTSLLIVLHLLIPTVGRWIWEGWDDHSPYIVTKPEQVENKRPCTHFPPSKCGEETLQLRAGYHFSSRYDLDASDHIWLPSPVHS